MCMVEEVALARLVGWMPFDYVKAWRVYEWWRARLFACIAVVVGVAAVAIVVGRVLLPAVHVFWSDVFEAS